MSARLAAAVSASALGLALIAAAPSPSRAETLLDAIRVAHETNPTLHSQATVVEEADESFVQAKAGYGPQLSLSASGGYQGYRLQTPPAPFTPATTTNYLARNGSADLSLVQPLYTGGANLARVRGADANILQARQNLRQAEETLVLNVVTAYLDVRRDRANLKIITDEIAQLLAEFDEIKTKAQFGELSKTDSSQAEARLLSARAQLDIARGRLDSSVAEYVAVVGANPGELAPEPDLSDLPITIDAAFDAAEENNPQLRAAQDAEKAAREAVNEAKAAYRPTVTLRVDAGVTPYEPYFSKQYDQSATAVLNFTQPLFTSGLNSSKVRQALDEDHRAQLQVDSTRLSVVQTVAQAWDALQANRRSATLTEKQVDAEGVAAEGYRVEERVGLRSTVDLLNAELEWANTRLTLTQDRHDAYVAGATLLAAMGQLETQFGSAVDPPIDPKAHLKQVQGIGAVPWEGAVETIDSIGSPSTRAPLDFGEMSAVRPPAQPKAP